MRLALLLLLLAPLAFADGPSIDDLVRQLGDEDFDVRTKATQLLAEKGEAARAALAKAAAEATDLEVRKRATDLLRELDRKAARQALQDRLQGLRKLAAPPFDPKTVRPLVEKMGALAAAETWAAGKSYHVTGDLTLERGAKLTIEPGVVVLVADGATVRIREGASLEVQAGDQPTVITSVAEKDGKAGHWGKLIVEGQATLAGVEIRRGSGVRAERNAQFQADKLTLCHTRGDGLVVAGSRSGFKKLTVVEATGTGLAVEATRTTVDGVVVAGCKVGIRYEGSSYGVLRDVQIARIQDEAVRTAGASYPTLTDATILDAGTGLRAEGASYPRVTNLTISDSRGDGVVVDGGSYPRLAEVKVVGAAGIGLSVKGGSYPYVGGFDASDCKGGNQVVEPNCTVNPLPAIRRPGRIEIDP